MKQCSKCNNYTNDLSTYINRGSRLIRTWCKPCEKIRQRTNYRNYRARFGATWTDAQTDWTLQKRYGITLQDWNLMSEIQNNVCALCGKSETRKSRTGKLVKLAVDHCHATGKVGKLLCWNCNTGLGRFNDSVEMLEKAIQYLKEVR